MANEFSKTYVDFSGGVQQNTTSFLMRDNELGICINGDVSNTLGGIKKTKGYEQVSGILSSGNNVDSVASYIRTNGDTRLLASAENSGGTYSNLEYEYGTTWGEILTDMPVNCEADTEVFMDKLFVVGYSKTTASFYTTTSITGLTSSTSDCVYGAPKGKYIAKYKDRLAIANVEVDNVKYPSRVYLSSTPLEKLTFVNGDQSGYVYYLDVDSAKYLKTGMKLDIYTGGTNTKVVDSLEIKDVNKSLNRIYFDKVSIDVSDTDDIYLEDKKGEYFIVWDTDNDYIEVATDDGEEITGMDVNANRLLIMKNNSVRKWDGAQLTDFSSEYGTISQKTIGNIHGWTIMNHPPTGVVAINGNEVQVISRAVKDYIESITNPRAVVAGVSGDFYKLYIGEPQTLGAESTTTSTSSTSTSSTSSSTSTSTTTGTTTSTSSTSTSISTSTTSVSTSSTSSSTSSTSSSTSSTSTSTTTASPTHTSSTVLVYNLATNAWTVQEIPYLVTSTCNHTMHGIQKMYFGNEIGRVYRDGVGNSYGGFPIPLEVKTKAYDFGYPNIKKSINKLHIYTNPGAEMAVMLSVDGGQYETIGQTTGEGVTTFSLSVGDFSGYNISVGLLENSSDDNVEIKGITFEGVMEDSV